MRVIYITAGALFTVLFILLAVRMNGLSKNYEMYPNQFYENKTPWVIRPWNKLPSVVDSSLVIWVDIGLDSAGVLKALPWEKRTAKSKDTVEGAIDLAELLQRHPENRWILSINQNEMDIDRKIAAFDHSKLEGKILIQSDVDVILRSIKELKPRWSYGSSSADRLRFRMFESAWILPATPFKRDVYVGPISWRKIQTITPAIVTELKRRHLKVILGPLSSQEEVKLALSLGADGIVIPDPALVAN